MPTVIGTLPELIGYSPEKLYLQLEGQSTDLNSDGHVLSEMVGSVVSFLVTPAMFGALYVARITDTVMLSGTPTESIIWTGFAVLESNQWTLQVSRPISCCFQDRR